jgi:adenylate cyclase
MPTALSPSQERHHRFVGHGFIYGMTLLILSLPIVATIFAVMEYLEPGKYLHYYKYFYLHFSGYLFIFTGLFVLRGITRWNTLPIALGVVLSCFIGTTFVLITGPGTGFLELQVALAPLGFIWFFRRPWYGAAFALFNLLTSGITATYLSGYVAPYPLPAYINHYLEPAIRTLAGVLFIAELIYLFAVSDLPQEVRRIWQHFSEKGNSASLNAIDQRNNTISNQIIIAFTLVMVFFDLAVLILCVILLLSDYHRYALGFVVYLVPSLLYTWYLTFCFREKNRRGQRTRFESLAYWVGLIFVTYITFTQNIHLGLHYLFLPLTLVPVFFSQASLSLRIFSGLASLAFFFVRTYAAGSGFYAIPEKMTLFAGRYVPYLNLTILLIILIYLWIKADLTGRFVRSWVRWSSLGTDLFSSPFDSKYRQIQNQLVLIFTGVLAAAITIAIIFLYVAWRESIPITTFAWHYLLPIGFQVMVHIAALHLNRSTRSIIPVAACFVTGIPLIFWVGISLQEEVMVHFFNLALLPLPYIGFSRRYLLNRILVVLASVGILVAVMGAHWFHLNFAPLKPLPIDWMVTLSLYIVPAALMITFLIYFQYIWHLNSRTEVQIENQRSKSDALLLNILPVNVAHELRESGRTSPILFNSASVMFTDFVGFTKIAEQLSPQDLIDELDKCFSYFDSVCDRYRLEKLKTIGDSFMAAGGIPVPNNTHAIDCCLAALEIQSFMNQMKEIKAMQEHPYWELRLGINTGNLVAGVVGEKKFAYDVWGDTVNTASRMESSGVIGKINISAATYEQVKYLFHCTHRGRVQAKNKGEIDMYMLEGIKPRYSVKGEGRVPNDRFHEIYEKIARGGRFIPKLGAGALHPTAASSAGLSPTVA